LGGKRILNEGAFCPRVKKGEEGSAGAMDDDDFVGPDRKIVRRREGGGEVFADINFPQGHCLAHQRWKCTSLAKELGKVMPVHFYDGMGPVDFQPASNISIIYLSESDFVTVSGSSKASAIEKAKERLRQAEEGRGRRSDLKIFCVFQKSPLSLPHLADLQVALLSFSVSLIPISSPLHLPQLLIQLFTAGRCKNPFATAIGEAKSKNKGRKDKDLLLAVCKIPGVKEPKARQLLAEKGSLKNIGRTKATDLNSALGPNLSRAVEDFFKRNTRL